MDHGDLARLRDEAVAACEGFNRKDVGAWLDQAHEDAVTFNKGFMPVAAGT